MVEDIKAEEIISTEILSLTLALRMLNKIIKINKIQMNSIGNRLIAVIATKIIIIVTGLLITIANIIMSHISQNNFKDKWILVQHKLY